MTELGGKVLKTPPNIAYGRSGVCWLPSPLRQKWNGQRLSQYVTGAPASLKSIRAEMLDKDFKPPARSRRSLVNCLTRWLSACEDEVADLPIVTPIEAVLDLSDMRGWPRAVLAAYSESEFLRLNEPPTFKKLAAMNGVELQDILESACLIEAAVDAGLLAPKMAGPARETDTESPTTILRDELEGWIFAALGMSMRRAEIVSTRFGLTTDPTPTLAESGQQLGVTAQRVGQLVATVESGLTAMKPALSGLEQLRVAWLRAVQQGPAALASSVSRWTADPAALAAFVAKAGDRRLSQLIIATVPPLETAFVEATRQLVHSIGAVGVDRLVSLLDEWACNTDDVMFVCGGDVDIRVRDGLAVSALAAGPLAMAVKKTLNATYPMPLADAYAGALRQLRRHRPPRLPTYEEFNLFVESSPDLLLEADEITCQSAIPGPSDLEHVLLKILSRRGGLMLKKSFIMEAWRRGCTTASAAQACSDSPLLDYACAGVIRRRGARMNLRRAEELRLQAIGRSAWAQWGWLDHERIWVNSRISEDGLRPSPPRDVMELLRDRAFIATAIDRTILGAITFDDQARPNPEALSIVGEHAAERGILEFRIAHHPAVVFLPGASTDVADQYPGDVDGCVLVDGRWSLIINVDDALLSGSACLMPAVLISFIDLEIGSEVTLRVHDGMHVRLKRETHAGVILGLGACLTHMHVKLSTWVRLTLVMPTLQIHVVGLPVPGSSSDLLARVGLRPDTSTLPIFAAIGASLGLGANSDRQAVANAFRRRGRPDLAEAALNLPREHASVEKAGLVARASSDGAKIIVRDPIGWKYIPQSPGDSSDLTPLGLTWNKVEDIDEVAIDVDWRRWIDAYLRVWLAANMQVTMKFEFDGLRWIHHGREFDRLLDAFTSVQVPVDGKAALPLSGCGFPSTGLGFLHLVRGAADAGIKILTVQENRVTAEWSTGLVTSGTLVDALTCPMQQMPCS